MIGDVAPHSVLCRPDRDEHALRIGSLRARHDSFAAAVYAAQELAEELSDRAQILAHMSKPLEIVGVDESRVGRPSNDGSAGSGLYAVPIRLSRRPSAREAELLIHHWDHPSSYTLMHRPGTATVSGESIVLGATTIDEVKRCHAATVRLAVSATNAAESQFRDADARAAERDAAEATEHEQHVRDVARHIKF